MASLAKDPDKRSHSIAEIAASYHLPQAFLEQIAFDLRRSRLLIAQRGRNGGYRLARSPEMISLVEILEVLEGPIQTVPCQDSQCTLSDCATRGFWEVLQRNLHKTLQRITLADLVVGSPHRLLSITDGPRLPLRGI